MAAEGMPTAHLRAFALDEYCGVGPDHPASYRGFLRREFFGPIGLAADRWQVPDGLTTDPQAETSRYEAAIRAAGGICIADEVQTGLGRLGEYYFAFEQQGAIPDVVVLGKPIGNGHPLAVVVTTPEIAGRFGQKAEFFSTFGGSNLSCRIGKEVLDIVDDEGLARNAALVGGELLSGLRELQARHEAIGQVRGMGLFTGVDLVTDRESRTPATAVADHVINRLRDLRILIGREGPADNVLKIRPPLSFDSESVAVILDALDTALTEAAAAG